MGWPPLALATSHMSQLVKNSKGCGRTAGQRTWLKHTQVSSSPTSNPRIPAHQGPIPPQHPLRLVHGPGYPIGLKEQSHAGSRGTCSTLDCDQEKQRPKAHEPRSQTPEQGRPFSGPHLPALPLRLARLQRLRVAPHSVQLVQRAQHCGAHLARVTEPAARVMQVSRIGTKAEGLVVHTDRGRMSMHACMCLMRLCDISSATTTQSGQRDVCSWGRGSGQTSGIA